jgi:hypothetical protein
MAELSKRSRVGDFALFLVTFVVIAGLFASFTPSSTQTTTARSSIQAAAGATVSCDGILRDDGVCVERNASLHPIVSISAMPREVSAGYTTSIAWVSANTASCTVKGDNGDGPWHGTSSYHTSGAIQNPVIYTLSCTGFDGMTLTKMISVTIISGT